MPEGMEDRIARLERRTQRLSALVATLACGGLVLLAAHWLPHPVQVAREFLVREGDGPPRAELGMRSDGVPVLRLNDAGGRARLYAVLDPGGRPALRLTDSLGVHRLVLEQDASARPYVELNGPDGAVRAIVSVDETGFPWAELRWHGIHRRIEIPPADTLVRR